MTYYDILSHIITNHIPLHSIIHPPSQTVMLVSSKSSITGARRPHGVSTRRNSGRTADRLRRASLKVSVGSKGAKLMSS